MLVLFVFIAVLPYLCASSQNYLSSLTLSSETQATESDITVFVNATFQDSVGQISWCIGSVDDVVGFAVANSPIILINYIADSPYRSRINISAQGDNYTIQSQILITSVKKNENLEICVLHGAFDNPVWTKLNVTDCPSVLPHGVHITATYFTFGSSGIFACPSNGELFYSNGTLVASSSAQTQCLADATWSQQENLECWNAPTVKLLPDNISGNEGEIIPLSCQASGGFPSPYLYEFFLPGSATAEPSSNISITLKREWNKQEIYCEAVSNYTALNDEGNSSSKKINVKYDPYSNHQPIDCRFFVNHSSSCEVEFYSNPPTDVYNLTKDGKNTTNDATNPLQSHADGLHTFTFSKNKVLQSDAGVYKLSVQSGLNPGNVDKHLVVNFTVVVTVEQSPAQQTNIALIAGASAAGAVILILVVVLLVIVLKRRKHAQKEVQNNPIYGSPEDVMINGSHELHQTTGGEKEEVVNPLYATSSTQPDKIEEAYGAVKKEKKKKKASGKNGKEEKVNPLYAASGSQDVIEEAYGQVAREGNAAQEESRKSDAPTPAAASAAAMANPQDVYAPVDFSKKANRRGKGEASGMVAGPSSSNDVEAASEVHGKKKGKSQKAAAPVAADAAVGGPADIYAAPDMSKKANRKANGKNQEAAAAVPAPVPFPAAAPVAANADAAVGGPADIYAAPDMSKKANRKANGASSEASSSQEKPSKPKKPKKPKKGSDAARANPPRNDDDDDNTGNGLLHGSSSTERPENVYHVS